MPSPDPLSLAIRDVPDFPEPGIVFKDITPLLADPQLFNEAITRLCETADGMAVDKIAGIDARGFIFAAAVADRLGMGFVPLRKKGKLPWKTRSVSYALEYGEAIIEIHEDAVRPGERVLIVDDLLATGGTAAAAVELLEQVGAAIAGVSFLVELAFLRGREKLGQHRIRTVITC
ncbi:MAG: adenine phosphoribosyltransferase [Verrucomicrobiota bacterium]